MKNLEVWFKDEDGLELAMKGPEGKERLKIMNQYPDNLVSRVLFTSLGLMHLIAPYLPKNIEAIEANYGVPPPIEDLISAMYKSEKRPTPFIPLVFDLKLSLPRPSANKVVIAYSAGKDSMWNLWWAQEKYGPENVLAVHIKGLNQAQASEEFKYTKRQQKKIGFKLKTIKLMNGSKNVGFKVMRSRDMFLAGIIIPVALEFGASKVIIEGFCEADPREMFTGHEKNMRYFNQVLKSLHIPVKVAWRNDRKEMDTIKDLIIHRPNWLPHICNCFTIPNWKIYLRNSWKRRTPKLFSYLYNSQCGSCVKCRMINLARILYDPKMNNAPEQEIQIYLKNTAKWIKKKYPTHADMIDGSFTEYFNKTLKKYNLNNLKSS